MILDARKLEPGERIECDLCIVGAGAAGIAMAREFEGRGLRVVVLEGGGLVADGPTQDLYRGPITGLRYFPLHSTRLRYFGGTTGHWGGVCRPLRPFDLVQREWIPHTGWPIGQEALDAHYPRAQEICEVGPYAYEPEHWQSEHAGPLQFATDRLATRIGQYGSPTQFGAIYRAELEKAEDITVYLFANVLEIETSAEAGHVTGLRVGCLEGGRFEVRARAYVLATGGIENARLLLTSDGVQREGLGNGHDVVGRYFMEHVGGELGYFLPSSAEDDFLDYYTLPERRSGPYREADGTRTMAYLELSDQTQRELRVGSASVALYRARALPEHHSMGYETFKRLIKKPAPDRVLDDLGRLVAELDDATIAVAWKVLESGRPIRLYRCHLQMEQIPNPESRVTLAEDRDALGMRRAKLDWRLSEVDFRTIQRLPRVLGVEFARAGLGRFKIALPKTDEEVADQIVGHWHHMGTTRMHTDPTLGVVDANCRVHGVDNLYVAGSSVFPTGGNSVPTLTIVALALRLGAHLRKELS